MPADVVVKNGYGYGDMAAARESVRGIALVVLCAKMWVDEGQTRADAGSDGGDALDAPAEQEQDDSLERA